MFFWVTRGVSEVYIPPVQPEIIRPLHSITLSSPVKKNRNRNRIPNEKAEQKNAERNRRRIQNLFFFRKNPTWRTYFLFDGKGFDDFSGGVFLESEPISRVQDIFVQKRFRHVPVLDEKNTLCGIISDRDWMRWKLEHISETELGKTIGKIMKTRVLSVQIQAGIGEIVKVLFEERIGCLPVVNDSFQAIGIITRSDVLRAILRINEREFLA
ncbi:CBS domain protein [Leptospira borgpetersenii str. Noumea 25]|nr:CBS domain protein [Leptospira borgpetersenii str. Noumea 25]